MSATKFTQFLLIVFGLFYSVTSAGAISTIYGIVEDAETGKPVPTAKIELNVGFARLNLKVHPDGGYLLNTYPGSGYAIEVVAEGYYTHYNGRLPTLYANRFHNYPIKLWPKPKPMGRISQWQLSHGTASIDRQSFQTAYARPLYPQRAITTRGQEVETAPEIMATSMEIRPSEENGFLGKVHIMGEGLDRIDRIDIRDQHEEIVSGSLVAVAHVSPTSIVVDYALDQEATLELARSIALHIGDNILNVPIRHNLTPP